MVVYRNSFHNPHNPAYGPEEYVTDAHPEEYKGFKIYQRIDRCFDCVLGGADGPECIAQYAGISGAKKWIDNFWAKQSTGEPNG